MRIEELLSSLEAQELCINERNSERELEQALEAYTLKASSRKKNHKQAWIENNKMYGDGVHKL